MEKEELKFYKNLATQGDAEAQFQLGEYYCDQAFEAETEKKEEKSCSQGIKWYTKAAVQGHLQAQLCLGEFYEYGIGVEEDHDEAAKYYRLAAEQGNVTGQYCLAELCYNKEDYAEAVKWFKLAADQGDADSQCRLGDYYYFDKDDDEEALRWYKLSAAQGNSTAQQMAEKAMKSLKEKQAHSNKNDFITTRYRESPPPAPQRQVSSAHLFFISLFKWLWLDNK